MLRSMTGFGAASREEGDVVLSAEVRAVNHRHLNLKLRLPHDLSSLEPEVEALVRKRLERGSVTAFVSVERKSTTSTARIDAETVKRYRDQVRTVGKELGLDAEVSLETLLGLPGVVVSSDDSKTDAKRLKRALLGAVDEALGLLISMREVEGKAIHDDLQKNAAATAKIVRKIERRMPTVVKAHQKNLAKRVSELLDGRQTLQAADVAREIALLADRLDVSEELSRLASHLDQLASFLAKGGRVGRKLDFLVQEIFREVNTIGSKCSDAKVAHWVVEAKTHVERLREQVQNVE